MRSSSRVILTVFAFLSLFLTFCKDEKTTTTDVECTASALTDTVVISKDSVITVDNDTVTALPCKTLPLCFTGRWTVEKLSNDKGEVITDTAQLGTMLRESNGITISSLDNPEAKFCGKLFHSYTLRWDVSLNGKLLKTKHVVVNFKLDNLFASSFSDSISGVDTSSTIAAKPLHRSLRAKWTMISNSSDYIISQVGKPGVTCDTISTVVLSGYLAQRYQLKYEVTSKRDSWYKRSQTVVVRFDYFTDPRDEEVYRVIMINGKIWMAQNLRTRLPLYYYDADQTMASYFSFRSLGMVYNTNDEYFTLHGCNYMFYALTHSLESGSQYGVSKITLAPKGWHVADTSDWEALYNYVKTYDNGKFNGQEGYALKSKSTWFGTGGLDYFGFSVNASGFAYYYNFNEGRTESSWNVYDNRTQSTISSTTYLYNKTILNKISAFKGLGDSAIFWAASAKGTTEKSRYTYANMPTLDRSNDTMVNVVVFSGTSNRMKMSISSVASNGDFVEKVSDTKQGIKGFRHYFLPVRCVKNSIKN